MLKGVTWILFEKHYVPVGSVVGLKNDSRRLLIIGRQLYSETNHVIRDYAALEYPNGFVSSKEKFILFDRTDIEIIYHYGYVDEKEVELDRLLYEAEYKGEEEEEK
ncbi:DUF4176 domain-containing protein [Pseudogracilibacillus auburnensis]|uniref:DUF4176 domain-containing protein n=1 Tax=Pseudogracilibacillus auburnensis TaxID=1494959 RepID=A0A2V3VZ14_9BACI|nr:DUF4176 domain-containing protein [Pseudogracilibacillus auburnensis]PXW86008.1 hypothetical protein DFR56_109171 [Pseudogracilibacillus auburnensis]